MSPRLKNKIKSPLPLAVMAGGFVWIVFDSVVFGMLAAGATLFLIKRDNRDGRDAGLDEREDDNVRR